MGAYNSAIITNDGQSMITQAIADRQTITFSSVKISSYAYPEGTNIAGLTDLQDVKQSEQPSAAEIFNETMIQLRARFGNEDVEAAYLIETIGIYAKLGDGEETLFAIIQAETPDQMPVSSEVSPSAFIYVMQITVQQASQISVTVNPAGTATVQDVENLKTYVENNFIGTSGDISSTTAEFEEPEELQELVSGENTSSVFGKLKLAVKNLKTLLTLIGTTDISSIGEGTVTGAIKEFDENITSEAIPENITSIVALISLVPVGKTKVFFAGNVPSGRLTDYPSVLSGLAAENLVTITIKRTSIWSYIKVNSCVASGVNYTLDGLYNGTNLIWGNGDAALNSNLSNRLPISSHGALYAHLNTGGWSTVTENGINYVCYFTGCCIFLSDKKCDIHLDIVFRDNVGTNVGTPTTHLLNMDTLKSSFALWSLSFSPEQTDVSFILGKDCIAENNAEDLLSIMFFAYNDNFSGLRFTSDGRLTRQYYDSSGGITYGNLYINTEMGVFRQGNIARVNIYGASYT